MAAKFVATIENYVTTNDEKNLLRNTGRMSQQRMGCRNKKKDRRKKLCHDKEKFVATNPPEINSVRQGKNVTTFKSLSLQLLDRVSYTLSRYFTALLRQSKEEGKEILSQ